MKNLNFIPLIALLLFAYTTNGGPCADFCNTHFGGHYSCMQVSFLCDPGDGKKRLYVTSSCLPPLPDDPNNYEECIPWY